MKGPKNHRCHCVTYITIHDSHTETIAVVHNFTVWCVCSSTPGGGARGAGVGAGGSQGRSSDHFSPQHLRPCSYPRSPLCSSKVLGWRLQGSSESGSATTAMLLCSNT